MTGIVKMYFGKNMSRNIQSKLHKVIAELILLFGSEKWPCPQEGTISELES
jgi:hypothetical protein